MTAHGRPRLFPPAYIADLYGGRDPRAPFDRELTAVATIALLDQSRAVALAEAVYAKRKSYHLHPRRSHDYVFRYTDRLGYVDFAAKRRIDTLHAQILRLKALSEHGILAL